MNCTKSLAFRFLDLYKFAASPRESGTELALSLLLKRTVLSESEGRFCFMCQKIRQPVWTASIGLPLQLSFRHASQVQESDEGGGQGDVDR